MSQTSRFALLLAAGTALTVVGGAMLCLPAAASPPLAKWIQKLPRMGDNMPGPSGTFDDGVHGEGFRYDLVMKPVNHRYHPDLPGTPSWTYNGRLPGPTFQVSSGHPIYVRYFNRLPTTPLFPVDPSLVPAGAPDVRTSPKLHGGHVPPESAGLPGDWFTPLQSRVLCYPNTQPSALLWYHDNAEGLSRTNTYAGLYGIYIVRDINDFGEERAELPFEESLIIEDKLFNADGTLSYPGTDAPPGSFQDEFLGDTIVVNGRVWPRLDIEPRQYRFRILNASHSRVYRLKLGSGAPPFHQMGNDGGFLNRSPQVSQLLIGPGERMDVGIDFTLFKDRSFIMTNSAPAPYPGGAAPDANTSQIVQINVIQPLSTPGVGPHPEPPVGAAAAAQVAPMAAPSAVIQPANVWIIDKVRRLALTEGVDGLGRLTHRINGKTYADPATEICKEGGTEVWHFINATSSLHAMHLDLVRFQFQGRRRFDVAQFLATNQIVFTNPPEAPWGFEKGWKDIIRCNPGEVTTIKMTFDKTADHEYTGTYTYHCQSPEHQDHEMMRPLVVTPTTP